MEMDRHVEVLADRPEGVVFRVVVAGKAVPHRRQQHARESVLPRLMGLGDGEVHVPVDGDAGETDAAFRRGLDELREEAVVRVTARPHEFAVRAVGAHGEARAEGRGVHLGDAVGKEDFGDDAVVVEHLVAGRRIPRALQLLIPCRVATLR